MARPLIAKSTIFTSRIAASIQAALLVLCSHVFAVEVASSQSKPKKNENRDNKSNDAARKTDRKDDSANSVDKSLPKTKKFLSLGKVDAEVDQKMSIVTARLTKKPTFKLKPLQDHGSFLQLDLPGTVVPNPGSFSEGAGPYVTKIAVFQLTSADAAVRIFVSKPAGAVKKAARAEILDKRIIVTIDHDKLVTANADNQMDKSPPEAAKLADNAKEPSPAELIKADGRNEATKAGGGAIVGSKVPDLRDRLVDVAAFGGALLVLCGCAVFFRPFLRKRSGMAIKQGELRMHTINSLPLATKQKLSLIQVGEERILVGVTPENISYIATIDGSGANPATATAAAASLTAQASSRSRHRVPFSGLLSRGAESETTEPKVTAPSLELQGTAPPLVAERNMRKAPKQRSSGKAPARSAKKQRRSQPSAEVRNERHDESRRDDASTFRRQAQHQQNSGQQPAQESYGESPHDTLDQYTLPTQGARPAGKSTKGRNRAVNIAVGDDGAHDLMTKSNQESSQSRIERGSETQKAIDDVTKIIREKLKNLRTI